VEVTLHIPHIVLMILFYGFLVFAGIVIGIVGLLWFVSDAFQKASGSSPWWW
jgi:hypothetical protein